ncbi:hypothetical protein PR202_gb07956 [Eleusine coracana subsp. coracana]|uniref:Uncharacterized protein n=1 Tax=Eleusine coracana subsp. coracana TaxID=191504 RepID=A0AAV5EB17_ELECO|nr:hypothetical protein QOZ80_2BG0179430 [Eleusine coracana subsp. coracana]GJN20564.1 hypothetical protein PR202_gb07956 [Eleusine coracana subsp. coracana]
MEQPTRNGGGKVAAFHFQEATTIGRHRNVSVSSYHDNIGRRDVVDAGRATAAARPLQQPQGAAASRRRTYADGELDVFSAERYFKGPIDGGGVHRNKDGGCVAAPLEIAAASANSRPAAGGTRASAASVTSASSANSRTKLLRRRGDGTTNKCCGVHVGALMRSCSGKRSVRVDDTGGAAKKTGVLSGSKEDPAAAASKVDWYRELRMQKAALGVVAAAGDGGVVAAALPPNLNSLGAAKVEDKLVEFTSSRSGRGSFTLVAAAQVRAHVPANGNGRGGGKGNEEDEDEADDDDDGAGSESSSDLFEIKSLMIEECPYEPSEASVQWSVNTSSASEHGGDRVSAKWITGAGSHRGPRGPVVAGRLNRDRQPAALLSGCVSHKAVQVSAVSRAAPNRR